MKIFSASKFQLRTFAIASLAFIGCGISAARAQYTVTGTTAGGGKIIVGNGSLGVLSNGSTPALSSGGFDQVTLNLGSVATGGVMSTTIEFETSNNLLVNYGAILGFPGNTAVDIVNFNTGLSNETVKNYGGIMGGSLTLNGINGVDNGDFTNLQGSGSGEGGVALDIQASDYLIGITLENTGAITGGNGAGNGGSSGSITTGTDTITDGGASGGTGGDAVFISSSTNINGLLVTNSGLITGGNGSGNGGNGGSVTAGSGITGGGGGGGAGGTGLSIYASDDLINATILNYNTIAGGNGSGNGGNGGSITPTGTYSGGISGGGGGGGAGGTGFSMQASGNAGNIVITNNGNILGGNGSGNGGIGGSLEPEGIAGSGGGGGRGGDALYFYVSGTINGGSLTNNGLVRGGDGTGNGGKGGNLVNESTPSIVGDGGDGGRGGSGMEIFFSKGSTSFSFINNGMIVGGNGSGNGGVGGDIIGGPYNGLTGDGGYAGRGGSGVEIFVDDISNNIHAVNYGTILGGNGSGTAGPNSFGTAGPQGGTGLYFSLSSTNSAGSSVTNYGTITGGNGGVGGQAGVGVIVYGSNGTLNNWGAINTGQGPAGSSITLYGQGHVINLNGHSTVSGMIVASGSTNTNTLNFNFTGLTPAEIASAKAQLSAQGVLTGTESSGSLTLRGTTYAWDPLVVHLNVTSYQLQALTPNQQAIGIVLDNINFNPPVGSPLFNLYNAIDQSGNVPLALQSLSPQQYQAYGDLAILNSTGMVLNVDDRLNNLRDGSENIDTTGMGGSSDATTTAGYSKDSKETKNVVTAEPERRWGFFATAQGMFFRGNARDVGLQSAKSNDAGVLAGIDGKAGQQGNLGVFFAYNNSDVTLGGAGSNATIESYSGGIYGAWHNDGFFVNALAGYTRNDYRSTRSLIFPGFGGAANGSTNGNQYTGNIDGGYDWHATPRLTVGPVAGVQYVHLDVDGFTESGAAIGGLAVGSQNVDSLQSRVGGRLNYHIMDNRDTTFAADFHAAWQHEYLNDSRSLNSSFAGLGLAPFNIRTGSPRRDAAVVGAGVNFTFKNRLTLFAGYELQYWDAGYFQQTVNGGGRISF